MNAPRARQSDRSWSLHRRLFLLTVLAITGAWLTGGAFVYFALDEESTELYDERIAEIAHIVMSYADVEIDALRRNEMPLLHFGPGTSLAHYRYQIWTDKGELILRSPTATDEQIAPLDQVGLVTRMVEGQKMRTYVEASEDGEEIIMLAEPIKFRQTFIGTIHTKIFPWFIAALPLLLVITWMTFRRAVGALTHAAEQIIGRSAADLRPIEVESPPDELKPLLGSTNELLMRFAKALDSERRLTAAAAHELRTPLAAVRMQAQVAGRARTREELAVALNNLGVFIDRASRMLDQLLTLAKLEAMADLHTECVNLDAVAAGVLHDLTPLLRKRRIRVSTKLAPARVFGVEFGIAALMRNLIDNAAHHSPQGSSVMIETGQDEKSSFAMVRDTGPGIPEAEREHVFERFYRIPGSKSEGCGVGLSIVRTVLDIHHASIHLCEAEQGGLCACVRFPKGVVPTTVLGTSPSTEDENVKQFLRHSDETALPGGREFPHHDPGPGSMVTTSQVKP